MARPERHDVDYFPFFAKRGKTLNILQSKYGLEGIGFFTNLMRFLSLTPDHYYCIKEEYDKMNLFAEIGIADDQRGEEMIELMVKTEKLDKDLWENHKVIVCPAFLKSIEDAYKERKNEIITLDEIRVKFDKDKFTPENQGDNPTVCEFTPENQGDNPQSKEEDTKLKKSKEKDTSFSLSEELNPNSADFSQWIEKLREKYNALKIGPPFKKTAVNLSPVESSDLMKIMQVYDYLTCIKAMENYEKIKNSAEYDPGKCVYQSFSGFVIRGVEKFCDEANPFENFKRKPPGSGPPKGLGGKSLSGLNSTF